MRWWNIETRASPLPTLIAVSYGFPGNLSAGEQEEHSDDDFVESLLSFFFRRCSPCTPNSSQWVLHRQFVTKKKRGERSESEEENENLIKRWREFFFVCGRNKVSNESRVVKSLTCHGSHSRERDSTWFSHDKPDFNVRLLTHNINKQKSQSQHYKLKQTNYYDPKASSSLLIRRFRPGVRRFCS